MARLSDDELQRGKPILSIAEPPRRRRHVRIPDFVLNLFAAVFLIGCFGVLVTAVAAVWWAAVNVINHVPPFN